MSEPLQLIRAHPAADAATVAVAMTDGSRLPVRHVIGVGRNYKAHADEQAAPVPDRPLLFTKNPAACCLSGDTISIPPVCQDQHQTDYEGELALILHKPARDLTPADALHPEGPILGYCPANDVSARWWQKHGSGGQFYRGKSFDSFCPLGPHLTPAAHVPNPNALTITTTLNDDTVQNDTTASMIFPVAELLADITRGTTLLPGTLILTGTPAGVGMAREPQRFLQPGDHIAVSITGLGTLRNTVAHA